jgi:hypothetical protein
MDYLKRWTKLIDEANNKENKSKNMTFTIDGKTYEAYTYEYETDSNLHGRYMTHLFRTLTKKLLKCKIK